MTITITGTHVSSISRLNEVINAANKKSNKELGQLFNMNTSSINYYTRLALQLGFIHKDNNHRYNRTIKGNIFNIATIEEKARILVEELNQVEDIKKFNRYGSTFYYKELVDNGVAEVNAYRTTNSINRLATDSKNIVNMVKALNEAPVETGFTVNREEKKEKIFKKTHWNCECGMTNPIKVDECEMCGSENRELAAA